jgi:hypothetical protein
MTKKEKKKKRVGREFIAGWACPQCGQHEEFWAVALAEFLVRRDGTHEYKSDIEWPDNAWVRCPECGWLGDMDKVIVPEDEWADESDSSS